jgi:glucokinase
MVTVVAVDIGGTHARFAIAEVTAGGVAALDEPVTLKTADHASLVEAWAAFEAAHQAPLPRAAALSIASPITADTIRLTNNPWVIRQSALKSDLDVDAVTVVNDFAAVGHAVAQLPANCFAHLCGTRAPLPDTGVITVCGPGTGLGVAQVLRMADRYHVLPTEGGHVTFAPLDAVEEKVRARLLARADLDRVSAERVVSGPGIVPIYATLAEAAGKAAAEESDKPIWARAIEGSDPIAIEALALFCRALGSVAGDLALAQGAAGVVIAGGVGLRLRDHLAASGFAARFAAKGRFRALMESLPVKLIIHPQPGLFGAAAAFAQEHRT